MCTHSTDDQKRRFVGGVDWMLNEPSDVEVVGLSEIQPDVFEVDNTFDVRHDSGGDRSFTSSTRHSHVCTYKGISVSIENTLADVIDKNPITLASNNTFYRPATNSLCHCMGWKYGVAVIHSTVKCCRCNRNIRSTNHVCKIRDNQPIDRWIRKDNDGLRYTVRRNNFTQLAKRLPYTLPEYVINQCNELVPACQSVVFLDVL